MSTSAGQGRAAPGAYVAALASLPGMGPAALGRLLRGRDPEEAWRFVVEGGIDSCPEELALPGAGGGARGRPRWSQAAGRLDPLRSWELLGAEGVGVCWPGHPAWPAALARDPEPPGALFWLGSLDWLSSPCVAVVGTRGATHEGRAVALELGRDLATAGVCVVSGLALGIDGAAHEGALAACERGRAAGPVGVAASGVDVPYPREHARLWRRVASAGALVSETPPGRPAQAWRFPARNRVIAALVQMVVVVESRAAGGSLITVDAALARGVEVRAVPGPVRSPASEGTNRLLCEGAAPVRHAGDVLDGLGIFRVAPARCQAAAPTSGEARAVLDAVSFSPTSLNRILERSGLGVAKARRLLDELVEAGTLRAEAGGWSRVL